MKECIEPIQITRPRLRQPYQNGTREGYPHRLLAGIMGFVATALSLVGCTVKSDQDPRSHTRYQLRQWAIEISGAVEDGRDEPIKYSSLKEALAGFVTRRIIDPRDVPMLREDVWGNAFVWSVEKRTDGTAIRVLSLGPDGFFQNGDGDDMWVEILIQPRRSTKITYRLTASH